MAIWNERIRSKRQEKGITLAQIAAKLGVTEATAQRYESGNIKSVPYEHICAYSEILGCSPTYLMGWDENTNKNIDKLDPDIRRIQRAREKMPESGKAYMMDMLKRSFSEYFEDDGEDDPD